MYYFYKYTMDTFIWLLVTCRFIPTIIISLITFEGLHVVKEWLAFLFQVKIVNDIDGVNTIEEEVGLAPHSFYQALSFLGDKEILFQVGYYRNIF